MIKNTVADFFTQQELIELYHLAGSVEESALQAAALEKYPERMAAPQPPMLKVETGLHGRVFCNDPLDKDAPTEEPKYTIKSGRCSWVGVLEDGTAIPY